jgi:hypothetical protein
MGKKAHTSFATTGVSGRKLAQDLRKNSSLDIILNRLDMLSEALDDEETGEDVAVTFLDAGGLPTLIQFLKGPTSLTPTTAAVITPSDIALAAATALTALLRTDSTDIMKMLEVTTIDILPLIDALRDAPLPIRYAASKSLQVLGMAQWPLGKVMKKAGVMELVLDFCFDAGGLPNARELTWPASGVALFLAESVPLAARQYRQIIRGPQTNRTYTALVHLQVHLSSL